MNLHQDNEIFAELIEVTGNSPQIKKNSEKKKLLKNVENIVTQGLSYLEGDEREKRFKIPQDGPPLSYTVLTALISDKHPVICWLKSMLFTNPEPFEIRELRTFIAEYLTKKGEIDLIDRFGLENFSIKVLSRKRTLVEKMLGKSRIRLTFCKST